ncbi:MAG: N-acetyltransferase [Deltaproteobacteria bacterium]|nr:N-acetyltransferase [Deltaproteobacteria bacterium]
MQLANVEIRPERADDVDAIRNVHIAAFASDLSPVPIEGALVDQLRADPAAWLPALSLVAIAFDTVVGHVICTRGYLDADVPALALGPIGVDPSHQRRGIGSALVRAVCAAAEDHGEVLVALLGDPAFYSRLGFVPAADLAIAAPLPGWARHFQVRPLAGFDAVHHRGTFTYPRAFGADP